MGKVVILNSLEDLRKAHILDTPNDDEHFFVPIYVISRENFSWVKREASCKKSH